MTRVKLSPEYPYLTFRITGFDLLQGYRNWTILLEIGGFGSSQVTTPQKGIFVYDLYQNISEKEKAKKAAMNILREARLPPRQPRAPKASAPSANLVKPASLFLFNDTATTEIYTLSLHDALPI